MPIPERVLAAGPDDDGRRFDRVLFKAFPSLSRTVIFRLIRKGQVRLNGKIVDCNTPVQNGDRITVKYAIAGEAPHTPKTGREPLPAPAPVVEILFQDANILAVNKPRGVLAHGPGSLEQEVIHIWAQSDPVSLSFKPGPINRLDRNTSGIQLFSLSLAGARLFSRFFHEHILRKVYCGIVGGIIDAPTVWEDFLLHDEETRISRESDGTSGKPAKTRVSPVLHTTTGDASPRRGYSLVLFVPETGRTHQIRLQAQIHGHPLSGDGKYGGERHPSGYLLHAIGLSLPGREYPFPDVIAPLSTFGRDMIANFFGKNAIGTLSGAVNGLLGENNKRHFP